MGREGNWGRILVLALGIWLAGIGISSAQFGCGNADGSPGGGIDVGDLTALLDYQFISNTLPPSLSDVDLDNYYGVTMHDVLFLQDNLFGPFHPLECAVGYGPLPLPLDPTTIIALLPASLPAGEASVTAELSATTSYPISGLLVPLTVLVDGQPADSITNIVLGTDFRNSLMGGARRIGGNTIMLYPHAGNSSLGASTRTLATFKVYKSAIGANRRITVVATSLPPTQGGKNMNVPMVCRAGYPFEAKTPVIENPAGVSMLALPTHSDIGQPVFFTGNTDIPVNDATWEWDFGDGSTGTGRLTSHVFNPALPGPFDITVSVVMLDESRVVHKRIAYIYHNPVRANFSAVQPYGQTPLSVSFSDLSTNQPDHWFWEFGDGSTSTDQNPTHIYTLGGNYTVCLNAGSLVSPDNRVCANQYARVSDIPEPDLVILQYTNRFFGRAPRTFAMALQINNIGSAVALPNTNVTLTLVDVPSEVTLVNIIPTPESYIPGVSITWSLGDDIAPYFGIRIVGAVFSAPTTVEVGTVLKFGAEVSAAPGETILWNNQATFEKTAVASWDPNDKQVQPVGCGENNAVPGDELLRYWIQFENKPQATAAADYVLIVDTLDPNLDWSTFQLGPSSHDSVLAFDLDETTGEMLWLFSHIDLPPNVTSPEGEGFVSYSIKALPGLPEGTVISNRAHIRFDNEPWLSAPGAGPVTVSLHAIDANHNGILDVCEPCCVNSTGNVDCDPTDGADIGDLTMLIDNLFITFTPLCCVAEANCDGIGSIDIGDLTKLIDNLFITFSPLSTCP